MARHRARRDHDDRRGAAAGAALPARDRRPADVYDLFADEGGTDPADLEEQDREPQVNPELLRVARDDWARGRVKDRRPKRGGKRPNKGPGGTRGVWTPSRQRGRRAARPRRAAAGDRVHLQPGRLRRRGPAVPERQPAPDHARGARRDLRVRRGALLAPPRRGPRRCSATTSSSTGSPAASPRTTPACCPTFKECVEELFLRGLCRVVFATETLALGINMPARSVVIEKLSKWNGETHADITPGEYTQLTGRAGRRGIDVEGHGVVLWQQGFDPKAVAGLASTRTYPLKSSFRPSYNMAVNLVHQFGREHGPRAARVVVRAVPGRQGRGRPGAAAAQGRGRAGRVRRGRELRPGDFMEYAGLRHRLSETEKNLAQVAARRPSPGGDRLAGVAAPR